VDREAHAAVEHGCRKAAVHGTGWIEMAAIGHGGDHNPPALRLGDVVAQGFSHRIQGQRAIGEALNKLQATHLFLPLGAYGSVSFAGAAGRHLRNPRFNCAAYHGTRVARTTRFLESL
jgi:hypothetical protein